ncbi:hypothetical protein Mapa_010209 [Marchantia paleacea]|nr:hypothetical protein Mapa_010209 [Marchantia paleacea]
MSFVESALNLVNQNTHIFLSPSESLSTLLPLHETQHMHSFLRLQIHSVVPSLLASSSPSASDSKARSREYRNSLTLVGRSFVLLPLPYGNHYPPFLSSFLQVPVLPTCENTSNRLLRLRPSITFLASSQARKINVVFP